ncbi:DNA replication regulator Sld3 [Cordyceps fumosorosea ARSEF 2679]|uniref:DNA replication regulator Sld3 n=1 Tax=Cordyceps fumosorosea (strain ARSEF 2679) TaxID=1081104 RepID=A0A162JIM7_CORFA|nr:DNA replication regulator Sld3 [Cordyceps fumosorosea ARSEF 2679]OAA69562.1 DNA replication regulator Sld3 [Cordyceps fumosorosea ARSEF 2679]
MSSSVAADDRVASHSHSGILTQSSDEPIDHAVASAAAALPEARGKRRSDAAMERLLRPSIAVKPHPHALHVQPKMLSPLFLLRRQDLLLGCIDFRSTADEAGHTRLVESRVKILDLEARMVGAAQSVLIARHDGSRRNTVYALERQDDEGRYAICRLGAWVDLERLAHRATAICADRVFTAAVKAEEPTTTATTTTAHMNHVPRSKRAAIEAIQSLVRKKPKPEPGPSSDDAGMRQPVSDQMPLQPTSANAGRQVKQQTAEELQTPGVTSPRIKKREDETSIPEIPCVQPASVQQTHAAQTMDSKDSCAIPKTEVEGLANDAPSGLPSSQVCAHTTHDDHQDTATKIFEHVRAQYFEALYKSMGSLAYFAKGPLSRARSTFHLDLEANLDMTELIDFLKGLILTTVQIDKKYHETAPKIISELSTAVENSDENRSRRRKSKKMTLSKNGLYPHEDDRIRKWWNANKPDEEQLTSAATQIKSRLSVLRTRETQLQMILIMEILALEPLKAADDAAENSLPLLPGEAASQAHRSPAAAHIKKRNKHNLPVLIDVHADRLTIWQSTAADEQQLGEDSQANDLKGSQVLKPSSEPLKDFCTDVIVPFFSARIPDMCNAISKKLGGPVLIPAGGRSHHRSAHKKEQKPGSVTKRPAAPRPVKTLERALSTDQHSRRSVSRGPSNMIALLRSATSTSLPKREGSEPANPRRLPKMEGDSQRRPAFSRSSSSISTASQDVSKASRKAMVDAQVKDAIAALRKPNREVVGQAMEEADQQRALAAKKARKAQRSSIVKATPANNRFRDVFALDQGNPDTPAQQQQYMSDVIPPSSIGPCVPSTGHRSSFRNPMDLDMSPAIDAIGSTPTKQRVTALMFPPSPCASSSLLRGRPEAGGGTAAWPTRDRDHVFATPVKKEKHQQQPVPSLSPVRQPQLQDQTQPQKSIYEALGWDDDYDF